MITEARRVKFIENEERDFWFFTKVCLVGQMLKIPSGVTHAIYRHKGVPDYVSKDLALGEVTTLPTCTMIAPGGRVFIHNSAIDYPVVSEGGLHRVANGIHPVGSVDFVGDLDSVMHCVSPREDMKGFDGKELEWVNVAEGESLTFGANIVGFVVVYGGPDQFKGFTAEPGDVYTAPVDVVLAVVTKLEEQA